MHPFVVMELSKGSRFLSVHDRDISYKLLVDRRKMNKKMEMKAMVIVMMLEKAL